MSLKNKRILITAGPTWVPIDKVRVISNIATGETGIFLAERFEQLGAKVTLLLGPIQARCLNKKVKLIRFKFFNELKDTLLKELKSKKYDALIHTAAVSDYKPLKHYSYKVGSGFKKWDLSLVPTEKIINLIKKNDESVFLVGFKFKPQAAKELLIKEAQELIRQAKLNWAVANTLQKNRYLAYVVGQEEIYGPMFNKRNMVRKLVELTGDYLWEN